MDVILRPDPHAAQLTTDARCWGGTLVFRNIPFEPIEERADYYIPYAPSLDGVADSVEVERDF